MCEEYTPCDEEIYTPCDEELEGLCPSELEVLEEDIFTNMGYEDYSIYEEDYIVDGE